MAEPKLKTTRQHISPRALQRVPSLAGLEDEALAGLCRRRYAAGETILRCNIRDGFLGIVESGEVSVSVELHHGLSFNGVVQAGSSFTLNGMRDGNLELSPSATERGSLSTGNAIDFDNARITVRAVVPTTLLASFRSGEPVLDRDRSLESRVISPSSDAGKEASVQKIPGREAAGREMSLAISRFIKIFLALIVFIAAWNLWTSSRGRNFRADVHYARGIRALKRGRENIAAWKFWSALNLNPSHAASYNALGYIYYQRGQFEKAYSAFRHAVRIDDSQGELHNNLGVTLGNISVHQRLGQEDTALARLQRAAALDTDAPEIYVNLGNVYLAKGDAHSAARAYREALRLDPELAMTHYNLGVAYYAQRQLAEAHAAFERAVDLDSDLSPAYLGLGILAFEQGDLVGARIALQRAMALNPQEPIAHFYLGLIYKGAHRFEESVLAFERVLGLTDDDIVREQAEWHLKELWGLP